jgi:PadR family transcriptional regulator
MSLCYILNDVKHIEDYYAPVLGEFEQLVLMALVRVGNGGYGASIRREIQERTGRDLAVSSVYVTLKRLEAKKMVCSYTGSPTPQRGGRRRTHYVIDAAGERALGRAYRMFVAMAEGVHEQLATL